eukprot:4395701-Amphidinium_carterae.1
MSGVREQRYCREVGNNKEGMWGTDNEWYGYELEIAQSSHHFFDGTRDEMHILASPTLVRD